MLSRMKYKIKLIVGAQSWGELSCVGGLKLAELLREMKRSLADIEKPNKTWEMADGTIHMMEWELEGELPICL